jgi:hypothetical protein
MEKRLKIPIIFLLALLSITCKKEAAPDSPFNIVYKESQDLCYSKVNFGLAKIQTHSYFKGKFRGKEFCFSDGINDYESSFGVFTGGKSKVINGVAEPFNPATQSSFQGFELCVEQKMYQINNDYHYYYPYQEYAPGIRIRAPITTMTPREMVDSLLVLGGIGKRTLIKDASSDETKDFDLIIDWMGPYTKPDIINQNTTPFKNYGAGIRVNITPKNRKVDNYKLKIVEIEKEDLPNINIESKWK